MAVLVWTCVILSLGLIHCYENLSRKQTTTLSQSSTYKDRYASYANDTVLQTTESYCAHTATGHTKAWFQVDLGKEYSIKSVTIYYRHEGNGPADWKQYRFKHFYLDVSNLPASASVTNTTQRKRCYTDTSTGLPNYIVHLQCKQTARYIIVETTYDTPQDDPTTGAILEICEIEVYGCDIKQYGDGCQQCDGCQTCDVISGICTSVPCSVNCVGVLCDSTNGHCTQGCNDGYWGNTCISTCPQYCNGGVCARNNGYCTQGCTNGYWGNTCTQVCPPNCQGGSCDRTSGDCNGCKNNYWGQTCYNSCSQYCNEDVCDQSYGYCSNGCQQGRYGNQCESNCNANCAEGTCNQQTGKCGRGCQANWDGDQCDRCKRGFYGDSCNNACPSCPSGCNRDSGDCEGTCPNNKYGSKCELQCSPGCTGGCNKVTGACDGGCVDGKFGTDCSKDCNTGCITDCGQNDGRCKCKTGWRGDKCDECSPDYYGQLCDQQCSFNCVNGTCFSNNGTCVGGCTGLFSDNKCTQALRRKDPASDSLTALGAGVGAGIFVILLITIAAIVFVRLRRKKQSKFSESAFGFHNGEPFSTSDNKLYTNIGNVSVSMEDPDEEPQLEKPEESVYYNDLSVAKDIAVADLLRIITEREAKENEGFSKEYKSLPYGERFDCRTAKLEENMPKNRFKTTFPYDHSRVVLEVDEEFPSDYINANFIENMDGKREYIASQGPRPNTLVDHWRMIWQEHVQYIVMLTNLKEGPKVKCHQYWPNEEKELDVDPFLVTLLEEKVYAYFIIRKMAVRKKEVKGSRTVVQYHYTKWPDHGTPNPLDLLVFHRQFRHKMKPSPCPILVHCSAGIGRTGTFIALDVLSRHGEAKGKINVIEFVKAMRKDRMTMIQNVDQYMFLYHALYEFFRRKTKFTSITKEEFVKRFGEMDKIETKKRLSDEFNELTSVKPKYCANDFKSGTKHSKLNATKSVLPVDEYLVYLTSNLKGRETYYNAVRLSSFTGAEEFISAQHPVPGAAIDLVRLLIDQESPFLISMTPLSEVDELKDWVNEEIQTIKLEPYEITKNSQTNLSKSIRKTSIGIKKKGESETHRVQIFECLTWNHNTVIPAEISSLTDLIKQFSLDRKSEPHGYVTVMSIDGATSCGVFCAVYNAIEQLQLDDEVDFFTIVQQLQCRRPEMISKKEEYEFCFRAVCDYMNSDNVYANT